MHLIETIRAHPWAAIALGVLYVLKVVQTIKQWREEQYQPHPEDWVLLLVWPLAWVAQRVLRRPATPDEKAAATPPEDK